MRVCLFEDPAVAGLEPVALSRPAFDLLCGLTPLADKQLRHFGRSPWGAFVRPPLADLVRAERPGLSVNDPKWLAAGPTALVNARWLPPPLPRAPADGPHVALAGGEVAYAVLGPEQLAGTTAANLPARLDDWRRSLPQRPAGGRVIAHLWDLVDFNGEQIIEDYRAAGPESHAGRRPANFSLVGPSEDLLLDPTATVDPLVVADTTGGPVVVAAGATVHAFTRLEGPCYVGPGTHVLGAKVRAGTTLGPNCRVGGEVEASIIQGHSNKYHDGFLGHSYVGEWVNLAAGTHTGDLRVDYGEVSVSVNGRRVGTGLTKVGSFLGDHVKTGLGVLLNAGTTAGPFAHLLPCGRLLPRRVPAFAVCSHTGVSEAADPAGLFATAAVVSARRGKEFTPQHEALFRAIYDQSAARDAEPRRLRRSA
jgi:UDP-N-acetylglucosamine diphosphorylase/glucosamine-1-phosphate N-acetyltransferase